MSQVFKVLSHREGPGAELALLVQHPLHTYAQVRLLLYQAPAKACWPGEEKKQTHMSDPGARAEAVSVQNKGFLCAESLRYHDAQSCPTHNIVQALSINKTLEAGVSSSL